MKRDESMERNAEREMTESPDADEFTPEEFAEEFTPEEIAEMEAILADAKDHPEKGIRGTAHSDGRITFFNPDGTTETI